MVFEILTLFPEFFSSPCRHGVIGRALSRGLIEVVPHNLRDHTIDRHRTTDDSPYGGGHGMVMKVEPVVKAIEALKASGPAKVVLTTPQGERFTQGLASELTIHKRLIMVCGRYEGYDERIREYADYEISIGDYVLSGGEIPALVMIDAVGRLIPGVLGEPESAEGDSFSSGLLEFPQYTRPEDFRGMRVPDVLLSGNHAEIERWRRQEALRRTFRRRPDLLEGASLADEDRKFLDGLRDGKRE
ncbi:MAG TPA: tRNA (guanosine(37)-N1)-methyltransferase TrmD [Deltaproteobacteria bacterium]|nr:MAG: tRNA (guanosine(37)-N1)-methyltransferase TrmD [Deltaproteobacteria bacterium GWA2_55_82]OGQ63234.1 MAG: tRNA (guanosine(37)-N1)-methyltransferase TrmD [Deltaproteobacteria bacterium RIFCSPLOWO2_02_FULL_55_12]OIJ73069.1 MAG: tRNA (guanosine(37)-N1)-methyltransferase TrmD [Deltaproteobacteria bacterium GWC2_55_46]HBG47830.1 tRNA (guanosine(37)-N1)-methyltransferase TrmD [Deltaproteobacteria bacterium]HCY11907.1 tRNA (guanosine(37)-N1)-methyltransferase TrmD [Deltaproteobacteria bacterium